MTVYDCVAENERRKRALQGAYDPFTGEGCFGERVRVEVADGPVGTLWLPERMMPCCPAARALAACGSMEAAWRSLDDGTFSPWSEEVRDWFWINLCEERIQHDFEFFAIAYPTIRDKESGRDIPFRLNRGQRRLLAVLERQRLAGRPIRVMVLKARQWGGSTLIQLYMFWIQTVHRRNWNSVICAHVKDAAITIRSMFERASEHMPSIRGTAIRVRNYKNTQNIKEVEGRGCTITVGTAEKPDSVRSQDAKLAHFSEQGYYPDTEANNPADLETSIVGSIPALPYTMVARESTANGVGNYFHTEWQKAKEGKSAYAAVFVSWYEIDIYSKAFDGTYCAERDGQPVEGSVADFAATLTEYEKALFANHPECTLENLNWRRMKLAEMPSESKMRQEYPSDDVEAFQDSGQPVFRTEDVERMRGGCRSYAQIGRMAGKLDAMQAQRDPKRVREILEEVRFVPDEKLLGEIRLLRDADPAKKRKEEDRLQVWCEPDRTERVTNRYLVAYDPQKGLSDKADWGVITVFDRYWMMYGGKPEVVAEWVGHLDKDLAVWVAAQVAKWYCDALLVVESNTFESEYSKYNESEFIFDTIAGVYDNLYSRTPADKIKEGLPQVYGWHTNRETKPLIVNGYIVDLRDGGYVERSEDTLNEALVYEKKQNGSYGAKAGWHDDRLMTRMFGLHVCHKLPLPRIIPALQPSTKHEGYAVSEAMV